MTTEDILEYLEIHRSIILTLDALDVDKVKNRISNKRSKDKQFLREEDNTRLVFRQLPTANTSTKGNKVRLQVTIVSYALPVLGMEAAPKEEDF